MSFLLVWQCPSYWAISFLLDKIQEKQGSHSHWDPHGKQSLVTTMTTIPQSFGKLTYSSEKTPCPVCGRTKDTDCRWNEDLLYCRTYAKDPPKKGSVVPGYDGRQWAYLGENRDGLWALFKLDDGRYKDNGDPSPATFARLVNNKNSNAVSAKPIPSQPVAASAPSIAETTSRLHEQPTADPPAPQKTPRPAGKWEFTYHDADGQPVIKVIREDDGRGNKDIRQRCYVNGKWVSRLNEDVTKRVRLYRIAEARALSEKTGHPIFMVEGESCVNRLMDLGIPATTSLGGSKKWTKYGYPNYLQDLQGCRVVLAPDGDIPGLEHMLEIECSLRQHGIEIAGWLLAPPYAPWENLPKDGGLDIVDWLDSGATVDQIWAAIRRDPPQRDRDPGSGSQDVDLLAEVEELSQLDQGSGLSLLPEILESPLKRLAGWLNLPPEAYYLSLLCAAASQISNRTRLELDRGTDYNVPPILWGGIVGETGSRKTPIINAITSPLDAIQSDLEQLYQARLEAYQAELREYEKNKREAKGDPPVEPKPTDLYVSDFTLEALCQVLGRQPERGLLVSLDELTTFFKSMDAYRNGKGSDRARWLEFYNARALKVDRKTTGRVYVPQTSISIIGGIQPSVIRGLWEQDKTGEDGLWARFAWVRIPITPSPGIQEGTTYDLSELLKSLYRNLGRLPDKTYRLDRQGIRIWNEWHHEIDRQILAEPSDILRASLPKTKDRAARIALVLHLIEAAVEGNRDPDTVIPAETLTKAICFTRWLQGQTRLLYGELGVVDNPEAARILRFVNRFKGCGSVKAKQVVQWWSPKSDRPNAAEARKFMEKIVRLGWAVPNGDPAHADYSITILSQPANHAPKSLDNQGFEPVGTSSQPMPTQPTAVTLKGEHATRTEADPVTNPAASGWQGWQGWQELADDANHPKASNGKHPGIAVGELAHLGVKQGKAHNEAYGDPIADRDLSSLKTVGPETPSLPRQPVDDADSSQQSHQRCGATVHNADANDRRVRLLDRDPVPPPLRGREVQLERETYRTAVVWIDGIRQRVPKAWLVEGSAATQRQPWPRQGSDTAAKTSDRVAQTATLSGSEVPPAPTLEDRGPKPSPTSPPPVDDNAYITKQDWNALVAACRKAGMRWIPSLKFIAEAVGVPVEKLDHLQITQRQYQQAMRRVEEYRRSVEKERRLSEALEKIEGKWFER